MCILNCTLNGTVLNPNLAIGKTLKELTTE